MSKLLLKYRIGEEVKESSSKENNDYLIEEVNEGTRKTLLIHPKKVMSLQAVILEEDRHYDKDETIFENGYQSWTDSRELYLGEKLHSLNHLPKKLVENYHFKQYGDSWFYPYHKHMIHSFTYSYIRKDDKVVFIGSLNENNAYLIIKHHPKKHKLYLESDVQGLTIDKTFTLFDYVTYEGKLDDCTRNYFSHFAKKQKKKISGYTSWYNHYQNISEEIILKDLAGINADRYDLFQIDDGYQTYVGDWLDINKNKFPNGLEPIVKKIHDKGLLAGIWMAPFVCEVDSKIFKEHPSWIYKENGKEVYAGCNWSNDVILDLENEEVISYIEKCLKYYIDLGFDFFKLDFLYAGAIGGKGTRAMKMRLVMERLRNILGDKLILGCGVPLSSAFGVVDYCRIGPDVSLKFDDSWFMRFMHRERISTKITLVNTIYRSFMDGFVFRNDPDVYLLRDDNIKLNKKQKEALIKINHLCGSVYFTSDNVSEYDESKMKVLEEAENLKEGKVIDVYRKKNKLFIIYLLNGKECLFIYNTKKGVLQ